MKRFKNIILLDRGDGPTLERGALLAQRNKARLTVVRVVKELPEAWHHVELGETTLDIQSLAVKECEAQLKKTVAPFKEQGLQVSTKVLVGTPFLEVIREVILHKRDLVIVTAEGEGGVKERLFGSTSLHLIRKCPCPVWVMKPKRQKTADRILAAVDPDDPVDRAHDALNTLILQLASSLAEREEAELHVVHAWSAYGEQLMRGRAKVREEDVRRYVQGEEARSRRSLNALIEKHTEGKVTTHLVKGSAGEVILDVAKREKADIVVMGTVCRTGIPGFFIGNTAEKILDEIDCSVLTVKPEGFQSPVELT